MAKSQSNLLLGLALVLLGTLFLLIQLDIFRWTPTWPLFVIVCGLLLILKFAFNRSNYGLLMPAILFLIIGTLFFYLEQTTYFHLNRLWPTFVLAPGLGFLFMFFFRSRSQPFLDSRSDFNRAGCSILYRVLAFYALLAFNSDYHWLLSDFSSGKTITEYVKRSVALF